MKSMYSLNFGKKKRVKEDKNLRILNFLYKIGKSFQNNNNNNINNIN